MSRGIHLSLLLLVFLVWAKAREVVERVEGESVTLVPVFAGDAVEIIWKIMEDKLVDLEEGREPHYYQLKGRAEAQLPTGSLTIRDLTAADSNFYTAEILIGPSITYSAHELRVLPPKPNVSLTIGQDVVNLLCAGSVNVTYVWQDDRGNFIANTANYTADIETLRNATYVTCIISNTHYRNNRTLQLDLPPEKRDASGGTAGIWVLIVVIVVVAGIGFTLYKCRGSIAERWRRCRDFSSVSQDDPVELTIKIEQDEAHENKINQIGPRGAVIGQNETHTNDETNDKTSHNSE